jgi:membrane protease YdiL (CAAX protease family)
MTSGPGVIVAVAALALAGAGIVLGGLAAGQPPQPLVAVLLAQAAAALPVLLALIVYRPAQLGLDVPQPRHLLTGLAIVPLAILVSLLGAGVVFLAVGQPPSGQPVEEVIGALHERFGLLGLVLIGAVLPGIVEEALLRGVVLHGLRRRLSPNAAIIITALGFALLHLSPWRLVPQFCLGVLLGWLTLRSGSCWQAAVVHAGHNAVLLVLSRLAPAWA